MKKPKMVTIEINGDTLRKQLMHPQLLLNVPGEGLLCTICDRRRLRQILSQEELEKLGIKH